MNNDLSYIVGEMSSFQKSVIKLFGEMDRCGFIDTGSVQPKFDVHLKKIDNRYKKLEKINLYEHTINCTKEALDLSAGEPTVIRDMLVLVAILHDFGKSPTISSVWANTPGEKHNLVSANMAKHFLANTDDDTLEKEHIKHIVEAIRNHHQETSTTKDKKKTSPLLALLIEADTRARNMELAQIIDKANKEEVRE